MTDVSELSKGLRRIITGTGGDGRSRIMIDDGPANKYETQGLGGLYEIWTDKVCGEVTTADMGDRGRGDVILSPPEQSVKIRWFTSGPTPEGAPPELIEAAAAKAFADIGATEHRVDTSKHPAMHTTPTLDAIILIKGKVRLILDEEETVINPGDVVVQRATNHAWVVEGDEPALFVAVLIDRRCD